MKAFYSAWLRETELSKMTDYSHQIESAVLSKYLFKGPNVKFLSSKRGKTAGKQIHEDRTWFCSAYQRNKCMKKSKHLDMFRGSLRLQSHICATCWLKDKFKLEHAESSSSCPHAYRWLKNWLFCSDNSSDSIPADKQKLVDLFFPDFLLNNFALQNKIEIPNSNVLIQTERNLHLCQHSKNCKVCKATKIHNDSGKVNFLLHAHQTVKESGIPSFLGWKV